MNFDVLMPTVVFFIVAVTVFSYRRFEEKVKFLFEERKLNTRDILLMVILMGVMVTIIAFIPSLAIQILFIAAYSYAMFLFVYVILKKWYLAVALPVFFVSSYFFFPNLFFLDVFAVIFAVIVSVYLGVLFSWKTTLIFAILLTIMDIVQVFGTGFMIQAAQKLITLKLPVGVTVPTYPYQSEKGILLGLGDIFLSGLLAIQTALKHGQKAGILTSATIGIAIFVFEAVWFNGFLEGIGSFPATVVVILGWALGIVIIRLIYSNSQPVENF